MGSRAPVFNSRPLVLWLYYITQPLAGKWQVAAYLLKWGSPLNRVRQKLALTLLQKLRYIINYVLQNDMESDHSILWRLQQTCFFNDFSVTTFYLRLSSVKSWLKTKPNFELYILAGRLIGVNKIGEPLSEGLKGGWGRLIEVAAK